METLADGTAVFGVQDPEFISVTLRQQLVFTPRLTAQFHAQLFSSAIRFGQDFYGASLKGRRHLSLADLGPLAYTREQGSHEALANVNAVVRWEYRLGSTLYFVYTRSQGELPVQNGPAPTRLAPSQLLRGPLVETLLVKWTYWWES